MRRNVITLQETSFVDTSAYVIVRLKWWSIYNSKECQEMLIMRNVNIEKIIFVYFVSISISVVPNC